MTPPTAPCLLADLDTGWLASLAARAHREPVGPRVPLLAGGVRIGSVAPALFDRLSAAGWRLRQLGLEHATGPAGPAWHLPADPSQALQSIGLALRTTGLVPVWRDEPLPVMDDQGLQRGSVRRDLVRLLGIATHSVHLVGLASPAEGGGCWVRQRAINKAEDPGLWDTLVGGTVALGETATETLTRELWEEAGLRPDQLLQPADAGLITLTQPRGSGESLGHQIEHIHCWVATLALGARPSNQDGEVAAFECLSPQALSARLQGDGFSVEAASVLLQVCRRWASGGLAATGS